MELKIREIGTRTTTVGVLVTSLMVGCNEQEKVSRPESSQSSVSAMATPTEAALARLTCKPDTTGPWQNVAESGLPSDFIAEKLGVSSGRVSRGEVGTAVCDIAVSNNEITAEEKGIHASVEGKSDVCLVFGAATGHTDEQSKNVVVVCPSN